MLDPALLRAGRFDRQITVGLPDIKVILLLISNDCYSRYYYYYVDDDDDE